MLYPISPPLLALPNISHHSSEMPRNNTKSKQTGQSATASVPLPKTAAPPPPVAAGAAKTVEELRAECVAAQKFAAWAATADDDEAPALHYYPKPAGHGKGVWTWKQKAKHDAQMLADALAVSEAAYAAAEAAKPVAPAAPSDDEELPRYVAPAEPAEVTAARAARYAADGRSASGVLLNQAPLCACSSCGMCAAQVAKKARRKLSDAECQAAVELFGWHHGAELILAENEGWALDELYGTEMEQAWSAYCAAMRASEAAREALAKAEIEARWRKSVIETAQVEARRCLKKGEAVQKCGRICTRCYSCEGNKHTDWEDGGKKARPSTLHVSSECFTHAEFVAGRIREDCPFLHTGDAGWHAEWDTNFLWDPMHPEVMPVPKHIRKREGDAQLCISEKSAGYLPLHLGGKVDGMDARQWRAQAQAQAPAQTRFSSLAAGGGGSEAAAAPRVPEGRFAALGGGSAPSARSAAAAAAGGGGGPAAAAGGGARRSGPGSAWARK